jgi:hypothetical protein
VTLGTALGLGLLPSVTRKLHATDTSTGLGVLANWDDIPPLVVSHAGGTLKLTNAFSCTSGKGVCSGMIYILAKRTAAFSGNGTANIEELTVFTWINAGGVPKLMLELTPTPPLAVAIQGGQGGSLMAQSVISADGRTISYSAYVLGNPVVTITNRYTTSACALLPA